MNRAALALASLIALGGCGLFFAKPPPPLVAAPTYVIGQPYQAGGVWQYPRADFGADLTGLAVVAPDHVGLTADGEVFDQTAMAAGNRELQLPAIIRVTNLENGRQVVLRLNDRGPENPGRLLVLTRRAAELLDARASATRVRVQVMEDESRALALSLQSDGPKLDVAAAPLDTVEAESLAPPGGASQSGRVRHAASGPVPVRTASAGAASSIPLRLPEQVLQTAPHPGGLYIAAGTFSRLDYASVLNNRLAILGARIITSFTAPREKAYRIRIGPLPDVATADAMLQRTLGAGVPDAAIVVE
jgi:rare lipoprotein A